MRSIASMREALFPLPLFAASPLLTTAVLLTAIAINVSGASNSPLKIDPSIPSTLPDYYDSLRTSEGLSAGVRFSSAPSHASDGSEVSEHEYCDSLDGNDRSNLIRVVIGGGEGLDSGGDGGEGDGRGTTTTYRLADVTALLPYTFGGSGSGVPDGVGVIDLWSPSDDVGRDANSSSASASRSSSDSRSRSSVEDHAAALLLACYHLNNGLIDTVVTGLPSSVKDAYARSDVRLTASIYDTRYSPIESTRILAKILHRSHSLTEPLPQFILGAYRSASTSPTAILSGVNGIPQVSYHSSGTDFDNKEQYPYFARMVPSSKSDARAVVSYLQKINVTYVGVLFVTDAFGSSYQKSLQDAAVEVRPPMKTFSVSFSYTSTGQTSQADPAVSPSLSLPSEDQQPPLDLGSQEIRNAISSLKSCKYRYFVAIIGEEHYGRVMTEAVRQGVAGEGYVWLFTGGMDRDTFQRNFARYPVGSPLARATDGIGLIQISESHTIPIAPANLPTEVTDEDDAVEMREDSTGYDRFRRAWRLALDDPIMVSYFRRKQKAINPKVPDYDFDTTPFLREPSSHMYFVYDAVVAMGLGLAVAGDEVEYPPGRGVYDAVRYNLTFEGASGLVDLNDDSGTREPESVSYAVWNARMVHLEEGEDGRHGKVKYDLVPTSHLKAIRVMGDSDDGTKSEVRPRGAWEDVPGQTFLYSGGSSTPPPQLPKVKENLNHIGTAGRATGLTLMSLAMLLAVFAASWAFVMRDTSVVRSARLSFLIMISVGCFLMASVIIPLSIDESVVATKSTLDAACMTATWIRVLGYTITLSGLIFKILSFSGSCSASWRNMIKIAAVWITINVLILLFCTLTSPFQWVRMEKDSKDSFNRTTETYAICTSDQGYTYLMVFIIVNLGPLIYANWLAYKARDIQTEYHESRYVSISLASILQARVLAIPIIMVVADQPQALFFVDAGMILVTCAAVLLLIFVPKVTLVYTDRHKEAEDKRRQMLQEVSRRAGRGQCAEEEEWEDDHDHESDNSGEESNVGGVLDSPVGDEEDPQAGIGSVAISPGSGGGVIDNASTEGPSTDVTSPPPLSGASGG